MKKQKENNKIFKSQLSKTKRIYIHIYFKKCPKGGGRSKTNKQRSWINEMASDGTWIFLLIISHHLSLFSSLWLHHHHHHHPQCLWSMCTISRWNVRTNKRKQTNQQKTDVVAAMVMEDKSMAVWGRVYSAQKLTEKQQQTINQINRMNKQRLYWNNKWNKREGSEKQHWSKEVRKLR